jgi:hypothetical protein
MMITMINFVRFYKAKRSNQSEAPSESVGEMKTHENSTAKEQSE